MEGVLLVSHFLSVIQRGIYFSLSNILGQFNFMFENRVKKPSQRTVTSKSSSRPKAQKKQLVEQIYTDTTGIRAQKSKSQCLPSDKITRKSIDVSKIASQVITHKTHGKNSNQSSQERSAHSKTKRQVHYDNILTDTHTQLKWSKKNLSRKTEARSVQRNNKVWDESKIPYSWETVLQEYSHLLTKYEQKEIKQYKKVYYVGQKAKKRERIDFHESDFDNQEKQYNFIVNDHIAYRFEILGQVGKGSYGQVFRVFDHKKGEQMALKMVKNKTKFTKQAFVEIQLLTYVKQRDPSDTSNMVRIRDFVIFRKHVCMVFQLLSENLYELIIRNNYNGISLDLIRRFAIQILVGLEFLRRHHVIHCDMKPENILLKEYNKSGIRIIDFGSSCFEDQTVYTYIQSRYYRAPEITLGRPYDHKIDTWSTGCILAELYTGVPLFPGQNENQQMKYFVDTLGLPPAALLADGTRSNLFFEKGELKPAIRGLKTIDYFSKKLEERIPDEEFRNFILLFLRWIPQERASPTEALKHSWIKEGMPPHLRAKDIFYGEEEAQLSECRTVRISKSRSKDKKPKLSLNNLINRKEANSLINRKEALKR